MKSHSHLAILVCLAMCLTTGHQCFGVLANAWHIPDNTSDLGFNMRSPEFEIGTDTTVTVYQGVQKYNNPGYGTANQTGGTLYYKGATQGSWSNTALTWHLNGGPSPNNQYWKASFNSASVGTNEVIQYYLYLNFDSGAENTYLYGGDGGSSTTTSQATAATSPFAIRNRPAWLFHAGNRVVSPGDDDTHYNVAFWIKLGYIGKDSSLASRWADHAAVYFTTDGATPTGSLGVAGGTSQAVSLALDHVEDDTSPAGNAMWWQGTVSNLPAFITIKYKIGAWHSTNNEEKFADYNAGSPNTVFDFSIGAAGDPVLTVNGLNANYTTTHVFVDETAADSVPLAILFSPGVSGVTNAEVFSNLNRRDRAALDANGDGVEDGIVPPDGAAIAAGDDSQYYKAYTMSPGGQPGQYTLTLNAQKTGAYRLTARYQITGDTNWFWYSDGGRRDHALVVAPRKARNITLYELNVLNIGSQGMQDYQRSTFTDLHGGPGSRPYDPVTNRFNLAYARNLGVNWLWFQPIHPIGDAGRHTDPATGQPYSIGSPYAVKNFFQVNPLMSKANTRDAAMTEFTNFVAAADAAGLNVMLDAAFNHTAWDCELDGSGVYYFASGAQAADQIRNWEARFYSRADRYDMRASGVGNVAVAPDRCDFGKWSDVADVFFGRYAALTPSAAESGAHLNEADWFDYSIGDEDQYGDQNGHFDSVTRNVWRYFSDYVLYWLDKTGCPYGTPAAQTSRGIDGLRADFGQGLPPQAWEYIINKARSRKWDFVFMSESLDGGNVTYRSNRHFDILNENIVFPLKSAATASDYRNIFADRRRSYGQGLVLLNTTSHDEENYDDPFQALIRYAACSSVDGAPMIFYGQELGITRTTGFDLYEINFSKLIPQFKKYNSLQPIFNNRGYGVDFLWPVYAAINQARGFSPALRSSNRFFLNQVGSGKPQTNIFSVAKYEQPNGSPNCFDVIFAFANLDRNNSQQGNFNVDITQDSANLFGIKPARTYNVRNIAAYTAYDSNRRNYWLWPGAGLAGSNLLANGIYVSLNPVPGADSGWTNAPFEPQYLKLYDVTPPATPSAPSTPKAYSIGPSATFTWAPLADPEGGVSAYHLIVGTSPGASNVFDGIVTATAQTITNILGTTNYAMVSAFNNAGIEGPFSPSSAGVVLLDPNGDFDQDGITNAAEDLAGTNPLESNTPLRILSLAYGNLLTWSSVSGKTYRVWSTADLNSSFVPISGIVTAASATASCPVGPATNASMFYRVSVLP
ncbi:MAG TPA: alpha-amylase family glycosyl hydrolase [Candidatus Paceibacterota bacterium]|nr:alpha-amylase family glycosyl hydrolase [Verrucomicrobiota bacterium]HSA09106.1 alpha-amylase family glycosyl hydrolase [Candidatus Paceibacterota bacterium]